MTPAARLSAAIEIVDDIGTRRRPAGDALKDWGLSHRFAGSGDRAAIAGLVYDSLRRRASAAWIMGAETPRAILLGTLKLARSLAPEDIAALCDGARFAPAPLSSEERERLAGASLADAPAFVAGDYPHWLEAAFTAAFGGSRVAELATLATRAPVDLRVNTLKVGRDKALAELAHFGATATALSPTGLRIPLTEDGRAPAVQAEPAFQKGWVEIQDEGSQLAALLAAPWARGQVVDLCAGAGGKSLALAAAMGNHGQIFATDSQTRRLAPIFDRLTRAGVRNVQVQAPRGKEDEPLAHLAGKADLVLVDAPCTGTGTWRRNPDAKWRLRPGSLVQRQAEQAAAIDRGAALVKPGGCLAYVTCSVLPEENDGAVAAFLARAPGFSPMAPSRVMDEAGLSRLGDYVWTRAYGLQMTPLRSQTDGFFVALLRRDPM